MPSNALSILTFLGSTETGGLAPMLRLGGSRELTQDCGRIEPAAAAPDKYSHLPCVGDSSLGYFWRIGGPATSCRP
ncbi:hypothetical protein Pla52o_28860 [Novipirellula galeiformis]|uniref:Uncharacterized protein n=1 Tax=Novipirellula galeiformis TaxID=2528004 RepID=A0A5C6CFF0_9BACT|nr:hypothetical protein Pla52o_28860 [Novipirellula galeiformis]